MKKFTLFLFSVIVSLSIFSQDSLNEKIIEMMELSGSSKNYDIVVERLLEIQKSSNSSLGDEFWDKLEKTFIDSAKSKIYEAIVPIYAKYLTEKDVDQVIAFYKSTAGQNLIKNMPQILQESMDVGGKIGEEMGLQVYKAIQLDKKEKFDSIYYGCDEAKIGDFFVDYNGIEISYSRTKNRQIETYKNIVSKYDITWIDDCRYTLKLTSSNNPNQKDYKNTLMTVTITSCDEYGFSYLAKYGDRESLKEGYIKKRSALFNK